MINPKIKSAIIQAVEDLEQSLIQMLVDTVKIPSMNPSLPGADIEDYKGGETKVATYLKSVMDDMGLETDLFAKAKDRHNIVGINRGAGNGKSLIFNGHIDVAALGPIADWTIAQPWSGEIVEGKIYGRGTADMKGGIVSSIIALKAIGKAGYKPKGDVIFQGVVGEEDMETEIGTGACLERGYKADAAIVVESTSYPLRLAICPVQANVQCMSITVKGKSVHCMLRGDTVRPGGAGSQTGVSSIDKAMVMYQGLKRLDEQWALTKKHDLWSRPGWFFIYPTVITGASESPALIPGETTITYIVKTPPEEKPEQVKDEVKKFVRHLAQTDDWLRENPPTISWPLVWPGYSIPVDAPICQVAHRAYETALNRPPEYHGFWMASDATFLNQAGIPTLLLGPGAGNTCHAANEYIEIKEMVDAAKIYALIVADWCGICPVG